MSKMFNFVKNIASQFFYSKEDEDDETESEQDIIRKIQTHDDNSVLNEIAKDSTRKSKAVSNSLPSKIKDFMGHDENVTESEDFETEIEIGRFERKGKITFKCLSYGLIDDQYYFTPDQIIKGLNLNLNDNVCYTVKKLKKNELERVVKIHSLASEMWTDNNGEEDEEEKGQFYKKIHSQVKMRDGRMIFMNEYDVIFSLNEVKSSFVPVQGDWLELKVNVEIDEDISDFAGKILKVIEIKPVRYIAKMGQITLWSKFNCTEGTIDKNTYFTFDVCESGYYPSVGDEVVYEAIESDQGKCIWRAISVVPSNRPQAMSNNCDQDENDLISDKCGIVISGDTKCDSLLINQTKTISLQVKNTTETDQKLIRTRFNYCPSPQVKLISHDMKDSLKVKSKQSVEFIFQVTARFIGKSSQLFIFHFENFKIGRKFEVEVLPEHNSKHVDCNNQTQIYKKNRHHTTLSQMQSNKTRIYGSRHIITNKFSRNAEKQLFFKVPAKLWQIMLSEDEVPKKIKEIESELEQTLPSLSMDLSPACYEERFHSLLFLEEMALRIGLRKYDMKGTIMKNTGEYLQLEVPGLAEKRPSLLIRDSVVVTQPWSEVNDVEQVGFIHGILKQSILIKFHPDFHDKYDESECDVHFESNFNVLQKCHNAVRRVVLNLGSDWLFPTSVREREPIIVLDGFEPVKKSLPASVNNLFQHASTIERSSNLERMTLLEDIECDSRDVESDLEEEFDVDQRGFLIPKTKSETLIKNLNRKKKIKWFNKILNSEQKNAVVNILMGVSRPLPYVIFGPPGTGKTITLVEAILQILNLIPSSRLLVASPSNSSADLICERLLDSGILLPGDLVRIVSFNRSIEGSIPDHLAPYCTVFLEPHKKKVETAYNSGASLKTSYTTHAVGRHRVTVGTCSSLGTLQSVKFGKGHFTHIIVDESGQATEPEIMIPISFLDKESGQVILAGDPLQLGPIISSRFSQTYGLDESFLQRITRRFPYARDVTGFPNTSGYDPRLVTRLAVNYRSVSEILNLPNQLFYDSLLTVSVSSDKGREGEILSAMSQHLPVRSSGVTPALVFHGVRGQNLQENDSPSWYNPQEIWEAVRYLRKLYDVGVSSEEIGIISPYCKQVQKIRYLISELDMDLPKVGSVEEFQGQERMVILLSAVRSIKELIAHDLTNLLGFIASPRRLNVSLTRARSLLIILGDPHALTLDPYWRSTVIYSLQNHSYTGCDLPPGLSAEEEGE